MRRDRSSSGPSGPLWLLLLRVLPLIVVLGIIEPASSLPLQAQGLAATTSAVAATTTTTTLTAPATTTTSTTTSTSTSAASASASTTSTTTTTTARSTSTTTAGSTSRSATTTTATNPVSSSTTTSAAPAVTRQAVINSSSSTAQLTPTVATSILNANNANVTGQVVAAGTPVHARAVVSSPAGAAAPTGSVLFHRFSSGDCSGTPTDETTSINLQFGFAESSPFTLPNGLLSYQAHYNGDATYAAADGSCVAVTGATPTVLLKPAAGGPATPVDLSATGYVCCDDTAPVVTVTFTDQAKVVTTIPISATLTNCTISGTLGFGFGSQCTGRLQSVNVPSTAASGAGQFTVSTNYSQSAQATFAVTPPAVSINPSSGSVHTTVLVSAVDFPCIPPLGTFDSAPSCTAATIQFDGAPIGTQQLVACGGANGFGFGTGCSGPPASATPPLTAPPGPHTFGVNGTTAPFTVTTPTVTISPTSGPVGAGTAIAVSATGFGNNSTTGQEPVTILFDGVQQGPPQQSASCTGGNAGFGIGTACGGSAVSISAPTTATAGPHSVSVKRGTSEVAQATFNVTINPSVATTIRDANNNDLTGKSVQVGATVHDVATVSGPAGTPLPSGTLLFHRYSSGNCSGAAVDETVPLDRTGAASSTPFSPPVGPLSYLAHYNGDANYTASDAACEALTVIPPPPVVTSITPTSGSTAGGTSVTIHGSGFVAGATVALGGAAATAVAVINGTTITATTPAHAEGTVNVTVTNPGSPPGTLTGGYTFAPPITLSPTSLPSGAAKTPYSQTITASGGTGPYTFAVTSGALPAGLTLSSGGVISGTPTATGSFPVGVTATDAGGFTGSAAYTLVINAVVITITPAPQSLLGGTVGVAYNQTITASGGAAPYTFTVSSGALPSGLTLTSAGVLSGTPTTAGSSSFDILATDANGNMGAASYTIPVAKGAATVTLSNLSQTYDGTAKSPTAVTNPSGLSVVFTYSQGGTNVPAAVSAGSYTVTATVSDANYTGSTTGTLVINAPASSPSSPAPSTPATTTTSTTTSTSATTTTTTSTSKTSSTSLPPVGSVQPTHAIGAGFNGQSDIVFPPSVAQAVGSQMGDYTVEFWAKPTANERPGAAIISTSAWDLTFVGGDQYVWEAGGRRSPVFRIPPLRFHHVAVTYRGASGLLQVFIDGQLVASQAGFPEPAVPTSRLYLGRSQSGQHWTGQLLYVRISKVVRYPGSGQAALREGSGLLAGSVGKLGHLVALAPAQAAEFFAPPPGPFVADVGSTAIWNLNEGGGSVIHDTSGNNFTGVFEAPGGNGVWIDSNTDLVTAATTTTTTASASQSLPAPAVTQTTAAPSVQALPSTGGGGGADRSWPALLLLLCGLIVAAASALQRRLLP